MTDYDLQSRPANSDDSYIQHLDPQGDLKLRNGNRLYLVSSSVLVLSSTYFRKMLHPDAFNEGTEKPQVENPPIKVLGDDDLEAFDTICRLLHFQIVSPPKNVKELAALADICDYYGCGTAITAHAQLWLQSISQTSLEMRPRIEGTMKLLWVAFVFGLEPSFEAISLDIATLSSTQIINTLELDLMPEKLRNALQLLHQRTHRYIRLQLENAISHLKGNKRVYKVTNDEQCEACMRALVLNNERCSYCGFQIPASLLCKQPERFVWFFEWLGHCDLWPMSSWEDRSIEELGMMISHLDRPPPGSTDVPHPCDIEDDCPLQVAKQTITRAICNASSKVQGLKLQHYR